MDFHNSLNKVCLIFQSQLNQNSFNSTNCFVTNKTNIKCKRHDCIREQPQQHMTKFLFKKQHFKVQ